MTLDLTKTLRLVGSHEPVRILEMKYRHHPSYEVCPLLLVSLPKEDLALVLTSKGLCYTLGRPAEFQVENVPPEPVTDEHWCIVRKGGSMAVFDPGYAREYLTIFDNDLTEPFLQKFTYVPRPQ